jgi:hypothetical protein
MILHRRCIAKVAMIQHEAGFDLESILTDENCVKAIFENRYNYLTDSDYNLPALHDVQQRSSPNSFLDQGLEDAGESGSQEGNTQFNNKANAKAGFDLESILTDENCVRAIFGNRYNYLTDSDHNLSAFHDVQQRSSPNSFQDRAAYVELNFFHAEVPGFDYSGSGYPVEQMRDIGHNDLDYDSIAKQQADVEIHKIYSTFPPGMLFLLRIIKCKEFISTIDIDMTFVLNLLRDLEDSGEPGPQEGNTQLNKMANEKADSILPQILTT